VAKPAGITEVWQWITDNDFAYSLCHSRSTVAAVLITGCIILSAILAPWISPHNPFKVATLDLMYSELPPMWIEGGNPLFPLGTDTQARDVLSVILYGSRISLLVGFASVLLAMIIGVPLGLMSGYIGGVLDAFVMRIADMMLTFPALLMALLVNGVAFSVLPGEFRHEAAIFVLICSIAITTWVQYARTVRASTIVEKNKEYVLAARLVGLNPFRIMVHHILPNIIGPVLVIATINLAMAILIEATLSFLGVGMPPTQPSLGTLIRIGNEFLFSGIWWVVIFPSLYLAMLVLSVNILGDWLRDALNPKLRQEK
jgi:peptide/nickel transport system permease protein